LTNFRTGTVRGYKRVFDHVGIIFIQNLLVEKDSLEISSVCAEEDPTREMLVSIFEIPETEIPLFYQREDFFNVKEVDVEEHKDEKKIIRGLMCTRFASDEALIAANFGSKETFENRFKGFYQGRIYRDDILPCRIYLKHCLVAAKRLGDEFEANFLNYTFIADRITTIRQYLEAHPGMMENTTFSTFSRYQG